MTETEETTEDRWKINDAMESEERAAKLLEDQGVIDAATKAVQPAFAAIEAATTEDNWIVAATARGLIRGYDARWRDAHRNIVLEECEKTLLAPLTNIETGVNSRTFHIAGKLDKVVQHEGTVLFDHKTTSSDIKDPDAIYWRQLQVASQPSHYELLLLAHSMRIDRIVWDVTRKPGIRPRKITKAEHKQIVASGEYCGHPVSAETRSDIATGVEPSENAELYEIRLADECIQNHERYFQRRSIPRTRDEIAEYASELWQHGQDLIATRNAMKKTGNLPPKNPGACILYNTPCQFLGICSNHDSPTSDKWKVKANVHDELNLDGDGRDVLTNSRISCFQTCRRRHYYEYELGIERIDAEERESLHFGTVWHNALDAWWSHVSGGGNVHCNNEPAAIGVADSKA